MKLFKSISSITHALSDGMNAFYQAYLCGRRDRYGYLDKTAQVAQPCFANKKNMYIYEHVNISEYSKIISYNGRFIVKKWSTIGAGLTVITQNHPYTEVGSHVGSNNWQTGNIPDDVIIGDYCWLGANVTLCPGTQIGRGCVVAAGSVCIKSKQYPPYTIIGGNPAKVIKYRFTIEEQLEHEKMIVPLEERLDEQMLRENYNSFINNK